MVQKMKSYLVIIEEDFPSFITSEEDKYEEEFKTDLERIEKIRNLDWEGKRNEFTAKI